MFRTAFSGTVRVPCKFPNNLQHFAAGKEPGDLGMDESDPEYPQRLVEDTAGP